MDYGRIDLVLDHIQAPQGVLHIALYDREESFSRSLTPYRLWKIPVSANGNLRLQLDSLAFGRYALAVFHDENNNNNLDKNLLGIPREPYGFSHNPRSKWSAPSFSETVFEVTAEPLSLLVSLKRWKDR